LEGADPTRAGSPQHVMQVCLLGEGHDLRRRPPRPENTPDYGLVGRLGSGGPAHRIQTAPHVSDYPTGAHNWGQSGVVLVALGALLVGAALASLRRVPRMGWSLLGVGSVAALAGCCWGHTRERERDASQILGERLQSPWEQQSSQYHRETLQLLVQEAAGGHQYDEIVDQIVRRICHLEEAFWQQAVTHQEEERLRSVLEQERLERDQEVQEFERSLEQGLTAVEGSRAGPATRLALIQDALEHPPRDYQPGEAQRQQLERLLQFAIEIRLSGMRHSSHCQFTVALDQLQAFRETLAERLDVGRLRLITRALSMDPRPLYHWHEGSDFYRVLMWGFQLALQIDLDYLDQLQHMGDEHVYNPRMAVGIALSRAFLRLEPAASHAPRSDDEWRTAANQEVCQLASRLRDYSGGWPEAQRLYQLHQMDGLPAIVKRRIGWLLRCMPRQQMQWAQALESVQLFEGASASVASQFVGVIEYLGTALNEDGPPFAHGLIWNEPAVQEFVERFGSPIECIAGGLLDGATILRVCPDLHAARAAASAEEVSPPALQSSMRSATPSTPADEAPSSEVGGFTPEMGGSPNCVLQ
jgi:hypothetical protein